MKKSITYFFVFICFAEIFSCKKQNVETTFTISGKLVESSSNPVPVPNYALQLSQKGSYNGLFFNVEGVSKTFNTDNIGNFSVTYKPEEYSGIGSGSYNQYPMFISGVNTTNIYPNWTDIHANLDVNLGTMYQYKKINQLVRKVQFNTALNANDTINIKTYLHIQENSKNIYGPIPNGTLYVLDTISQVKLSRFNIATNTYSLGSTTLHANFLRDFNFQLVSGDENLKEIVLIYP